MYYAKKREGKIVSFIQSNDKPEGMERVTQQEIDDFIGGLGPSFVTISIPLQVLLQSPELKDKLAEMTLIFSDIKRRPDGQGNLVLSNINLEDVPKFLTAEEYTNLTKVGVLFDEKITALFASDEDDSDE